MNAEKNRKRITEIIRQERDKMVGFVRRLINETAERDGEDIVHDVILNIFDAADLTIPVNNLSAYIYQSLRNKVIDLMRKRKDEISLDTIISEEKNMSLSNLIHDVRYDTVTEVEKNEIRQRMYDAVESLNKNEKAIVIMTEFEGRSFRDISEKWNIPIGTLLSRKSRAIKNMNKMLADLI